MTVSGAIFDYQFFEMFVPSEDTLDKLIFPRALTVTWTLSPGFTSKDGLPK